MRNYREGEPGCGRHPQGLTRRDFGRMLALLGAGSALPFYNEAALAQDIKATASIPASATTTTTSDRGGTRAA